MKEQCEDLESRCIEMISSVRWGRRKQLRWNDQIPRGLLMNIISSKISVIRVLEKNGKKQGEQKFTSKGKHSAKVGNHPHTNQEGS